MRPLLIALLPLAFSSGAAAQFMPRTVPPSDPMPGITDRGTQPASGQWVGRELRKTRDMIGDGRKNGELSEKEAKALRREARQIDTLADRYGRDGLTDSEQRELETRAQVLRADALAGRSRGKP